MKRMTILTLGALVVALSLVMACSGTLEVKIEAVTTPKASPSPKETLPPTRWVPPTLTPSPEPTAAPTATSTRTSTPSAQVQTATPQVKPTDTGAPRIINFTVSPTRVSQGDSVTLTWETRGGNQAVICPKAWLMDQHEALGQDRADCFDVPLTGSRVLTTRADATLYRFGLEVSNSATSYETQYVCIDVSDWFFENPPDECASAPPVHSYAAAQRFQHGMMIWIEETDEFIVLFDGPTWGQYFYVFRGPIQLKPGASVDNRVGDVPAGYFEPVSGFGLVWRAEIEDERARDVREHLGWAIEPEFGFETTYQRGIETTWHWIDRYIRGPDGKIVYLWRSAYAGPLWWYWER